MLGKKHNDTHFDIAMISLLAPVPLCFEPDMRVRRYIKLVLLETHILIGIIIFC